MKGQDKKGGEVGVNGEHYKGGPFMPASARTVKGQHAVSGGKKQRYRRVLIEPGVLVEVERGIQTIFARIQAFVAVENGVMYQTASPHTVACYSMEDTSDGIMKVSGIVE